MKFINVKQLIIKFMGGGLINFPTRFLRWIKIDGDVDGSDDSSDDKIDAFNGDYFFPMHIPYIGVSPLEGFNETFPWDNWDWDNPYNNTPVELPEATLLKNDEEAKIKAHELGINIDADDISFAFLFPENSFIDGIPLNMPTGLIYITDRNGDGSNAQFKEYNYYSVIIKIKISSKVYDVVLYMD